VITETTTPASLRMKALRGLGNLPPFSPILNKLLASLADEDVSFGKLADLVEKDTVLSGNVLRLVNSALYGLPGRVNSVRHALSLMGLQKLRNTTMSMSVSRLWGKAPTPRHWSGAAFNQHSVAVAILADLLVQRVEVEYPEGAFAAGLLHDIGLLLVAISLKEEFAQLIHLAEGGRSLDACEAEVLGFPHSELSAEALTQWNIPAPIREAVSDHGGDARTPSLARVLAAANWIADAGGMTVQDWAAPDQGAAAAAFGSLGLEAQSTEILHEFRQEFEAIRGFFA
jgi:HD-like signal output (HDOD) protein